MGQEGLKKIEMMDHKMLLTVIERAKGKMEERTSTFLPSLEARQALQSLNKNMNVCAF